MLNTLPATTIWTLASLLLVGFTLSGYASETARQVTASSQTYGTQVRLASWVEDTWPEDSSILTWDYSIPAAYLRRMQEHPRVVDWHDPTLPRDDPAALGAWLVKHKVGLVIWYSEEGTGGRDRAAYLESGEMQQLGPVRLEPLVDEPSYGMIAYLVVGEGIRNSGALPAPGWFAGERQ
jgi:hypothetical protein